MKMLENYFALAGNRFNHFLVQFLRQFPHAFSGSLSETEDGDCLDFHNTDQALALIDRLPVVAVLSLEFERYKLFLMHDHEQNSVRLLIYSDLTSAGAVFEECSALVQRVLG